MSDLKEQMPENKISFWSSIVSESLEKISFCENRQKELQLTMEKTKKYSANEKEIKMIERLMQQNTQNKNFAEQQLCKARAMLNDLNKK